MAEERDQWHRWLLEVRHGGDPRYREQMLSTLRRVCDEVLDRAPLRPDDTLLDIGTGDGLIAFAALDRLGPHGRVIFSDVSRDLLDYCHTVAAEAQQLNRCDFLLASAEDLAAVPDSSVDVVTTRSVLIYVADKAAAFAEFRRVLRPGGRLSLFEPINVLMRECGSRLFFGYDISPVAEIAAKLSAQFAGIQPARDDPMTDFDDRDLVRLAEQAGFADVELDLRVTVRRQRAAAPWDRFLRQSGNPNLPPLGEMLRSALSPAELGAFTAHLRPLVETGNGEDRQAVAYLTARDTAAEPAGG
ncbi:MAG TPA: methyltransferase domain-containing protein [Streptosporangiaceae bacterium]|nr:methyltransferase domain-containing protein [Streptosporangiaceae bacterium]